MSEPRLIEDATGRELRVGDEVTTFRGERVILTMLLPHDGQEGRVQVDGAWPAYYASVIGARFECTEPEIKAVGIGDRLANGATVLQVKPSKLHREGVAFLALSAHRDEFVTWVGFADGTGTTWGHYFGSDLAGALADLAER